jgi:plasmid stabilization system protein ParE
MKVLLSERVEADIAHQFEYGVKRFGQAVAERTFGRVDTYLFKFLKAHPRKRDSFRSSAEVRSIAPPQAERSRFPRAPIVRALRERVNRQRKQSL